MMKMFKRKKKNVNFSDERILKDTSAVHEFEKVYLPDDGVVLKDTSSNVKIEKIKLPNDGEVLKDNAVYDELEVVELPNYEKVITDEIPKDDFSGISLQEENSYVKVKKFYIPSVERLRFVLMFFMCLNLYGLFYNAGNTISTLCGFAPIAFYILSGYLVLRESENRSEKIKRTIKRTAIAFLILAVVYFIFNYLFYSSNGINIFSGFKSKRFWFNLIVLNVWPYDIGGAIWYVQALLYAYIAIYFLDKWKLLKYDWLIALCLIVFTVCTGELSGVFKFSVLKYTYIPGNFLTRAIPYVLLGGFISRKIRVFANIRKIYYIIGFIAGAFLMFGELVILDYLKVPGYYGHLLGMPIVAVSLCMLFFKKGNKTGFEINLGMSRRHYNLIYYICEPVGFGLLLLVSNIETQEITEFIDYIGIIVFAICFSIAWGIAYGERYLSRFKKK